MAIRVTRKGFVQRVSTRDEVAELATSPVCSRDAGRSVHLLSWWLASQFLLQDVGRAGPASAAAAGGGAPADPVVFRGVTWAAATWATTTATMTTGMTFRPSDPSSKVASRTEGSVALADRSGRLVR